MPVPRESPQNYNVARFAWMAAALVLLTAIVFSPVAGAQFLNWDDQEAIVNEPALNPPRLGDIPSYWKAPHRGFYNPVMRTVWCVAAYFTSTHPGGGPGTVLDPAAFHGLNLVLHAGCALLVFGLLARLTGVGWGAWFGAAVFALHPLQVEPVAWAANMYTPLSGALAVGAIWLFLVFNDARRAGRRGAWGWYAAATLAFSLGLLTKPVVVVVPLLVALLEVGLRGRRWREVLAPLLLPWAVLAAGAAGFAGHTQRAVAVLVPPIWQRVLGAGDGLAFYLGKLALPVRLAADYGRSPRWLAQSGALWSTWLVPAAVLLVAFAFRRTRPWLPVGVLATYVGVAPSLGLVPFDFQVWSTVADRYFYLAMLGPALAVAYALRGTASGPARSAALGVTAAVVVGWGVLGFAQARHWHDNDALWAHTLEVNPDSLAAHRSLGQTRAEQGQTDEAIAHYRAALKVFADDPAGQMNLGALLYRKGRLDEAVTAFNTALNVFDRQGRAGDRRAALVRMNLGTALARRSGTGDREAAVAQYRAALAIDPNLTAAQKGLTALTQGQGP